MTDSYVREIGRVTDDSMSTVIIGVDRGAVTITAAGWAACGVTLNSAAAEEFAQYYVHACWQAGVNAAAMAAEARDGD